MLGTVNFKDYQTYSKMQFENFVIDLGVEVNLLTTGTLKSKRRAPT
jgi:hypothetical protein